ncbi:outer-membrane lipoprotein carrier protein [Candidatus Phycosocius bacilliformis]|uniref:Outer-membrane lipoprotein carrier protein n=1 Tax=Candidatus Phycosocius bacilliformis TaxID=1445552 RepID=A0A2P2E684_9PROT|nr:outer-membrane lipoprotein carrier protein LolA [Candidatus Phycosocius bacilliformis]GBF56583.1 outer-membrane lipoprotein carrier protein [Candidatus Phycosocius bacilliformis]
MNRRHLLALCASLCVPGIASAQSLSGAERSAAIASLTRALNAITRLQGRFQQTNPDGTLVSGRFWLQRPGKVRFEYDAPSPLLLISDGSTVSLQDRRLRTTDRYPLRKTPLYFLLKANVSLETDVLVTAIAKRSGTTVMAVRDKARQADGELTVVFDEKAGQLREWSIADRQGRITRVQLSETAGGGAMAPSLFTTPGPTVKYDPRR